MRTALTEALDLLEDLVTEINWLGGDAYEMDAVLPTLQRASAFIEAHGRSQKAEKVLVRNGIYCSSLDTHTTIEAPNKRAAAKSLGIDKALVQCLVPPCTVR